MEIIDNYLIQQNFNEILQAITDKDFAWYYNDSVSHEKTKSDNFYFTHMVYNDEGIRSHLYPLLNPLLTKLNVKNLTRIKVNMYPRTETLVHHEKHIDREDEHQGAILYLNSNDGFTVAEGTNVASIENRVLLFDPSKEHNSTTCTNKKYRINININYTNRE